MRINAHAHIFNLQTVLTREAIEIIARRGDLALPPLGVRTGRAGAVDQVRAAGRTGYSRRRDVHPARSGCGVAPLSRPGLDTPTAATGMAHAELNAYRDAGVEPAVEASGADEGTRIALAVAYRFFGERRRVLDELFLRWTDGETPTLPARRKAWMLGIVLAP